jgi:hypothetical protein
MSHRDDDRPEVDPDAPITEEEAAASAKLRDALDAKSDLLPDAALARSLKAAWSPSPIDPEEHAALVGDLPDAEEAALAAALRDTIDQDPVVMALRAAYEPRAIDDEENRALVAHALATAAPGVVVDLASARRMRMTRAVIAGTTTTLALAASIILWISNATPGKEAPLAVSRSTQPLFGEPFKAGEASARIDRIALARASDYRDNRFARWGAK